MAGLSDLIVEQQEKEIWGRIQKAVAEERERCAEIARQIKARASATSSDDEKELRRQMAHIQFLADDIMRDR